MVFLDADCAERFRRTHELNEPSSITEDDLKEVIESSFYGEDARVVEANPDDFVPTDNAARPRSILVGDCIVEFPDGEVQSMSVEIQCVEEHHSEDAEHHEDGTISIPVGGKMETMYRYDTLEVNTF